MKTDENCGKPLINAGDLARAAEARLLIAITFHFDRNRLGYLEKVLQSLATFPVSRLDIVVCTNTPNLSERKAIKDAFRNANFEDGSDARLTVTSNLPHPYNLTWTHKKLISDTFLAPESPYSHFAYLEDDEQLTFENFVYFLVARDILRPFNMIPSFLRAEWSAQRKCPVNTDNVTSITLSERPFIADGDCAFVVPNNPYCGGFILDQDLAREYVKSRSFDFDRSREVSHYEVRERAAMGLIFENPPYPFLYRVVVPVSIGSRTAPQCA